MWAPANNAEESEQMLGYAGQYFRDIDKNNIREFGALANKQYP
jgi:hypothetical protein